MTIWWSKATRLLDSNLEFSRSWPQYPPPAWKCQERWNVTPFAWHLLRDGRIGYSSSWICIYEIESHPYTTNIYTVRSAKLSLIANLFIFHDVRLFGQTLVRFGAVGMCVYQPCIYPSKSDKKWKSFCHCYNDHPNNSETLLSITIPIMIIIRIRDSNGSRKEIWTDPDIIS